MRRDPPLADADALLDWLTDPARVTEARSEGPEDLAGWWALHGRAGSDFAMPVDRAILRGFHADRVGFAFAAGYQAALRRMVPDLPEDCNVSLCITEEGGGHPRAIETRLEASTTEEGTYRLSGRKQWSTLSTEATELLVAARIGAHPDGRPHLVLVRVAGDAPGVTITPMPPTPFAPEILHGQVELDGVAVPADARLPGDGYGDYVKPFRTIEDIHVHAALTAHLWRFALCLEWPSDLGAQLVASLHALRSLAAADPSARGTHIALGGVLEGSASLVERVESAMTSAPTAVRDRFERDRPLLGVGGKARRLRLERAFAGLLSTPSSGDGR